MEYSVKKFRDLFITKTKVKEESVLKNLFNDAFFRKVLEFSDNDLETFYSCLGNIYTYYNTFDDKKTDYSIDELIDKCNFNLFNEEQILKHGIFTSVCSEKSLEMIKKNGLGSSLNYDKKLDGSIKFLEKKLGIPQKRQLREHNDVIRFSAAGVSTFGEACGFFPKRIFDGILKQDENDAIPVTVGESKIDYYRKVMYKNFGAKISIETKEKIERILNSCFSGKNYVVAFHFSKVLDTKIIGINEPERMRIIDPMKYFYESSNIFGFFTQYVKDNNNKLDNMIMYNNKIPYKNLDILSVPDRYDLIQMIAKNKMLRKGDKFDFYSLEEVKSFTKSLNVNTENENQNAKNKVNNQTKRRDFFEEK